MTTAGPPGANPTSTGREAVPGSLARSLTAAMPWPVALAVACAACLIAQSGAQWLAGAIIIAWLVVLDRGLGIPVRAWMPTVIRWLLPVSVLLAVGGLLSRRARSGDWISPGVLVEGGVLLALLIVVVWSHAAIRAITVAPLMTFPFREGTWRVIEGEGRALNHHWRAAAQRSALDLVRLGDNGMSHRGLRADRVGSFFAFGTPVYSPCDGTILISEDGHDDTPTPGTPPAGNHLVIQTDTVRVLLGHLAKGTVLVHTGQPIHTGQELARIGNSGNSTEPHLHIHAQESGAPLRLRFAGRHRRLPRGATITT